jgi:site-specific recombinase XerD
VESELEKIDANSNSWEDGNLDLLINPHDQSFPSLPVIITAAGDKACYKFLEFFAAKIRNPNTRRAYFLATTKFLDWMAHRGKTLRTIDPITVAAYIESHPGAAPTVKQHLAAIKMLFDHLVVSGIVPQNPAAAVKGPRYSLTRGKTPVLERDDARRLLDSIPTQNISGLRDRALIGTMIYSFARIGAVLGMNVGDYYANGKRYWLRLLEKGGKHHEVPCHHKIEEYLDEYIEAARLIKDLKGPIFRNVAGKTNVLLTTRLNQRDALSAVKRRAKGAGLSERMVCNHTFRATGITAYLLNGGTLDKAQQIAAHANSQTTRLYDRSNDKMSLDEIERILL